MIKAAITLKNVDTDLLCKALSPELKSEFTRTKVAVKRLKDGVSLEFRAEDVNALRAAMNSYLRWLKVIEEINEELPRRKVREGRG